MAALVFDSGALIAQAGTSDVADAALCQLARDGDTILTSDPHDIAQLLQVNGTCACVHAV